MHNKLEWHKGNKAKASLRGRDTAQAASVNPALSSLTRPQVTIRKAE